MRLQNSNLHNRSLWLKIGLLFLASFAFQCLAMDRVIGIYDEGLDLSSADIVAHGGLPYRDIYTSYGPAQSYVIAALFKLFGTTALIARAYDLLVRSAIVGACAFLVLRIASRRAAIFAGAGALFWLSCPYLVSYDYPVYPALLFALLACCGTLQYLRQQPYARKWLFAGGACAGLAATFRHDTGFYAYFAQLVIIIWNALDAGPGKEITTRLKRAVQDSLLLTAGALLPLLLFFLPVVLAAGWRNAFYDLIFLPAVVYPKVRSLPYPSLTLVVSDFRSHLFSEMDNIVYFPIFAWFASALTLFNMRASNTTSGKHRKKMVVLLLVLDVLLFITGNGRVSFTHMMPAVLVGIALLSITAAGWGQAKVYTRAAVTVAFLWLFLCSLPPLVNLRWNAGANLRAILQPARSDSFRTTCAPPPGLERARCLVVSPAETAATQYIERNVPPNGQIYIGLTRHDIILDNDLRLYFLTGRAPATKWHMLSPGVQTTYPIQAEMVQSLEKSKPEIIVESNFPLKPEQNESRYSSGVTLLDKYIAANYTPEKIFDVPEGPETVFRRRDRSGRH